MLQFARSHGSVRLFVFKGTAPTEIYTLSLHDALPILLALARVVEREVEHRLREAERQRGDGDAADFQRAQELAEPHRGIAEDRKSTRLNSSHVEISYAVFCLKKKKASMSAARLSA